MSSLPITKFWWVRHAPVLGFGSKIYDHRDVAADVSNLDAFQALARRLPKDAVWVVSDMHRAQQTYQSIQALRTEKIDPITDRRIAEQDFGAWMGMSYKQLFENLGDGDTDDFWQEAMNTRPPNGESFEDLMDRTRTAIDDILTTHRGRDIILVSHGGTIRCALAYALGMTTSAAITFSITNLATTRIDYLDAANVRQSGWRVTFTNLRAE